MNIQQEELVNSAAIAIRNGLRMFGEADIIVRGETKIVRGSCKRLIAEKKEKYLSTLIENWVSEVSKMSFFNTVEVSYEVRESEIRIKIGVRNKGSMEHHKIKRKCKEIEESELKQIGKNYKDIVELEKVVVKGCKRIVYIKSKRIEGVRYKWVTVGDSITLKEISNSDRLKVVLYLLGMRQDSSGEKIYLVKNVKGVE